jgi:hypothetical protein
MYPQRRTLADRLSLPPITPLSSNINVDIVRMLHGPYSHLADHVTSLKPCQRPVVLSGHVIVAAGESFSLLMLSSCLSR